MGWEIFFFKKYSLVTSETCRWFIVYHTLISMVTLLSFNMTSKKMLQFNSDWKSKIKTLISRSVIIISVIIGVDVRKLILPKIPALLIVIKSKWSHTHIVYEIKNHLTVYVIYFYFYYFHPRLSKWKQWNNYL